MAGVSSGVQNPQDVQVCESDFIDDDKWQFGKAQLPRSFDSARRCRAGKKSELFHGLEYCVCHLCSLGGVVLQSMFGGFKDVLPGWRCPLNRQQCQGSAQRS